MKINYVCNCRQTDFNNKFSYWEDKNSTKDESEILDFLMEKRTKKDF